MTDSFLNELLIKIFTNLTKTDCKTAQFISIIWSVLTASFIFDTVYVDSQNESLKVFITITEHSFLNKKMINLSFDAQLFEQNIDRYKYLQLLLQQTKLELQLYLKKWLLSDINEDDCRFIRYTMKSLSFCAEKMLNKKERLCLMSVVNKEYKSYVKQTTQQLV